MQRAIRSLPRGLAVAAILSCMGQSVDAQTRPSAFVDVASVVPGLVVDLRYFSPHNFVGTRVDGYEAPVCILTRQAAAALGAVQRDLAPRKLGLKVFDCYRPVRAVAHFARWARGPENGTKAEFYPDIDKRHLFREGYLSQRSGHSRGSTVDLTLVSLPGNEELDMGTHFDFLSPRAGSRGDVSAQQRANRKLLSDAMRAHGFIPYAKEWWHFTLRNEPFPGDYFDFPVR
ncbi:peptidase M15 [Pseudorhodoplanes sinuspersici]|uniref:D-alanyl-D-alanine dipeptidase n=1 Tax=Pseudorhodoplanes sinuspersici TaxID=1235591 RepID=A0A1W7A0B1_9HYPH|nr:peptidase M15 [Pseudorhodoplanes sinuspersici]